MYEMSSKPDNPQDLPSGLPSFTTWSLSLAESSTPLPPPTRKKEKGGNEARIQRLRLSAHV